MPSDIQLYLEWKETYQKLSQADAAKQLAAAHGLEYDSVRGRLSRVQRNPALLDELAKPSNLNVAVDEQEAILRRSDGRWKQRPSGRVRSAFLSDIHFPYHRRDCLELTYAILSDFKPHYITVDNDMQDWDGQGRWDDPRSTRERVWSDEFRSALNLELTYYLQLSEFLAPQGMLVQVQGNHDNWIYRKWRNAHPHSEESVLNYMKERERAGVVQFTRGVQENAVRLSPALVYWHGQFVSGNSNLNAKNTLAQFVEEGVASTVVVGHTHRPTLIDGSSVGYSGVEFVNSGCLSRTSRIPYLKRDPKGWGWGIVLNDFDTNSRYVRSYLIVFRKLGDRLIAQHNGREYSVRHID
jgi:predicted phosphodiesterase